MEVGLSNRKSETEVMVSKPRSSESEENQTTMKNSSEIPKDDKSRKNDENDEPPQEMNQALENSDKVIPSALPPPEMFEIRNSPPLPFAGNKKLKKLIEKNKKYVSNNFDIMCIGFRFLSLCFLKK